jgi:hypothetical protein
MPSGAGRGRSVLGAVVAGGVRRGFHARMPAPLRAPETPRAPFTIPLHEGPLAAWVDRCAAAVVVGCAVLGTVLLARIAPDPKGYDTHTQLGLAPCGWPRIYGIPCPTCGCTTAACHLVHGNVVDAFATQPFGAAVAAVGLALGVHALWCLLRRRSFVDLLVRVPFGRWLAGAALLFLLSWCYTWATFRP